MSDTTKEAKSTERYTMRISRLTVDKLGIKLYDRVAAVLAELIANSYDADAENVVVTLPWAVTLDATSSETIVVSDDGHGMTTEEVNDFYLKIGADRRRRVNGDISREHHRPVMGRKGIGKLAPFGICKTIEVWTAGGEKTEKGFPVSHLILQLDDVLEESEHEYHPNPGPEDETWSQNSGTTITLKGFSRKRVPKKDDLDRQLGARFGLEQEKWSVLVQDSNSSENFVLGDLKVDVLDGTSINVGNRPVIIGNEAFPVTGFVAYSKNPYKDEAMAGVRIFARGKLVSQTRDFGIGAGFTGEYKLRSYLVGAIHAEWLDEADDLVRSDRQDIIWNSERGEALSRWGQELLRDLAKSGEESVGKKTWDDFLEKSHLDDRLKNSAPHDEQFRKSVKEAAKLLLDKKDREALDDPEHVERVVQLALSLGPHQQLLSALREASSGSATTLGTVVDLFEQARIAEMYSLGQVASQRVDVLARLEALVSDGATLEDSLQKLIEASPWILAPEWTPLGMNESLERVRASFVAWYKKQYNEELVTSAIGNPRREPDFVLLNDAGVLWIVEIKRMDYHLTDEEYSRALNYLDRLEEFLDANQAIGRQFPIRRLTFVVDHLDKLKGTSTSSLKNDVRIDHRTWHDLVDSTKRAHKDFLNHVERAKMGPQQP